MGDIMKSVVEICRLAMRCIVQDDYKPLEVCNALTRTAQADIKRVLSEYDPSRLPVMPPDDYFEQAPCVIAYRDGSGWHVDIDFWYPSGQSDLTLQLDIRKKQGQLSFIIDDIHVM